MGFYADVAEHYAERRGVRQLLTSRRECIDPPGLVPLRAHRAIARLPVSVIVTTNWDRLLETALRTPQAGDDSRGQLRGGVSNRADVLLSRCMARSNVRTRLS